MAISEIDICNMALGFLGAARITSLEDSDECFNNYPICRDACLEDVDWSFAIERFNLRSPATESPAYGFANKFLLASRVLRVIEVNENKYPWTREGNYILTDESACLVRAVVRVTNPALFSPSFAQMLAMRLAAVLAIPITNSKSVAETWWRSYGLLKTEATGNDGRQGTSQQMTINRPRRRHSL